MATLYITELSAIGTAVNPAVQIAAWPAITSYTLAIGSEVKSQAFSGSTRFIRVHVDAICSIDIGPGSPTATTSKARLAANQTEFMAVNPGDKLSVISNT